MLEVLFSSPFTGVSVVNHPDQGEVFIVDDDTMEKLDTVSYEAHWFTCKDLMQHIIAAIVKVWKGTQFAQFRRAAIQSFIDSDYCKELVEEIKKEEKENI